MNDNKYINTFQNTIVKGTVNPIRRDSIFTNIHLNSKYRDNYYCTSSSDFHITLPQPLDNVVALKLSSISVPNTWYLFSETQKNNTFYISDISDGNLETKYTITIPDGNYDAQQLANAINISISGELTANNDISVTFDIDSISCKSRFDVSCNNGHSVTIQFAQYNDVVVYNAGWNLGFRYGEYKNISSSVISEGLFDKELHRYLYLCLDDFNRNVSDTNLVFFDNSTMKDNVLGKIYLHNGGFKYSVDNTSDDCCNNVKTRRYFGPINLKKLRVKLLDQYGRIVILNNMDFSFSLEVEHKYKGN